ncbi:hypothetical protein OCK74_19040 [Chitinophagaceae bacterium LB-8]|jgi:hypothetical protein|uniref:NIPSNAP domain-containing protein n=1 Tax=Paraflavisolibacter caeni TaxID=2982496 RepID=A0A9X3B8T7_9BACT|nr:hypothetical protein [Paraflavisolibacter caeni]MCU7551225.1 hypothetical protein [Paraflavisolibacter caeni]
MYIIRDIFQLKFGHYRDVKALVDDAVKRKLMPMDQQARMLTDFTGDSYRLIFEESYNSLADFEKSLTEEMGKEEWQKWYAEFKPHIESSHREILKQVM